MWGTIVTTVLSLLPPIWPWICSKAVVTKALHPQGFTRIPEYMYPKGDSRNRIKIEPYVDFELKWCRELKEGDSIHNRLTFLLPMGSLKLQVIGWGCLGGPGRERFFGSLSDVGQIGVLRFSGRRSDRTLDIPIVLPGDRRHGVLRLADGNPIFSGNPSNEETLAVGLLGRKLFEYPSSGHQHWVAANIWASEVSIPWWAQFADLYTTNGSMHLLHVQVRRLVSPFSWLRSFISSRPEAGLSIQYQKDPEETILNRYARIKADESLLYQRPSNPQEARSWARKLADAGIERMTAAYTPQTLDRISEIKRAVNDFLAAADLVGLDHPQEMSDYYGYAFQAMLQLGIDRTLLDNYARLVAHYHSCLQRANDGGNDSEALRCRWYIGWASLQVARLVYLLLKNDEGTRPQDLDLESLHTEAGKKCFEIYHNQIARHALRSYDPVRLEVAKTRLDILFSNAKELGLTEEQIQMIKGTSSRIREAMNGIPEHHQGEVD